MMHTRFLIFVAVALVWSVTPVRAQDPAFAGV